MLMAGALSHRQERHGRAKGLASAGAFYFTGSELTKVLGVVRLWSVSEGVDQRPQ